MSYPNTFVIGVPKSGTSAIYNFLSQSPEVFMSPIKEPNYFFTDLNYSEMRLEVIKKTKYLYREFKNGKLIYLQNAYINESNDYFILFKDAKRKIIGECSTSYIYSREAAKNIYNLNSKAKVIVILRDPIERAFSHHLMNKKAGYENINNFEKAVENDFNKQRKGWGISHLYIELGLYYKQLKRWFDIFDSRQILICDYSEFKDGYIYKKIKKYLNLNDFPFTENKYYEGKIVRFSLINYIIKKIIPISFLQVLRQTKYNKFISKILYKKLNIESRNYDRNNLIMYFSDDIQKLRNILIEKEITIKIPWINDYFKG